jgi:hypothetical protein
LGKNSVLQPTYRSYSLQISHHYLHHCNDALRQYYGTNKIHQKINLNTFIMETTKILIGYAIYLPVALFLTYYVSRTLFKNSKVYMMDIFKGREEIANATNKLFETGFYLLNLGFALMILEMHMYQDSYQLLIENLSYKIGGFTIYLGIMLFLNLYFFFRGKRKASATKPEEKIAF